MTRKGVAVALTILLGLAVSASADDHEEGQEQGLTKQAETRPTGPPCPPTVQVVTTGRVRSSVQVPPDQDVRRGQCLFSSTTAFGQQNPNHLFASCNGCHPGGRTDQVTHVVDVTNSQGQTVTVFRQTPDLRNVVFNVPLTWDGRRGGSLNDAASVRAAIKAAAQGAILSPREMRGTTVSDDQLESLAAFLIPRSLVRPGPNATPPVSNLANLTPQQQADAQATLDRIATGQTVFFGKGQCTTCHPAPFFTDNTIRTNVLNPDVAFDVLPDPGRGFVTGNAAENGQFKTPSLHHFYPTGAPHMHNGGLANDGQLFRFYQRSLGFTLTGQESTGLHYWLVNCARGPFALVPPTCFSNGARSAVDFAISQGFTLPPAVNVLLPPQH